MKTEPVECFECNGSGYFDCPDCGSRDEDCQICFGCVLDCQTCDGTGVESADGINWGV